MDTLNIKLNDRWKHAALSALFFLLVIHGYRYFQTDFSHDSMAFAAQQDIIQKISVGRYMQPLYWLVRGKIAAPFIVGVFSYVWLVPTVYLMGSILGIRSKVGTFLLSGMVIANMTLVGANATYIHDADTFCLSMLLNTLAIYLCVQGGPRRFALAAVCIAVGIGLYQAYVQFFISLTMLWAVLELPKSGKNGKEIWKTCILSALTLVAGLVLYVLGKLLAHKLTGIQPDNSYHNSAALQNIPLRQLLRMLPIAWAKPFAAYTKWLPKKVSPAYAVLNGLVILWAICVTINLLKKRRCSAWVWVSTIFIAGLVPLGMNSIYVIYQDQSHDLMHCAFFLPQAYAIALAEQATREELLPRRRSVQALALVLCAMLVCKGVWANQVYLKKTLEADSTRAVMVRVLDRIELLDGYVPGETPVHFVGMMRESPLMRRREAFAHSYELTGSHFSTSLSFTDGYWTFWSYFEDIMGYPIQPYSEPLTPAQESAAEQMPLFPAADSVQLVDGLVLVRFA